MEEGGRWRFCRDVRNGGGSRGGMENNGIGMEACDVNRSSQSAVEIRDFLFMHPNGRFGTRGTLI